MRSTVMTLALILPCALLASTFMAAPLPEPPPLRAQLPAASPPAGMALFQLPTGVIHRNAAFAYRGGSFFDARDFAATAVLVKHPAGDLLIDTGFGREIDAHFQSLPALFRAITSYRRTQAAADLLDRAGYDRSALRGILLTHAHWDHVSGLPDFPDTPVLVTPAEHRYVREGDLRAGLARSFRDVRYEDYAFERKEYLGFAYSRDFYGDGSIVIVPAAGHTPGSVIVFVSPANGERYVFVGDLVWQREGISQRAERPWLQRLMVDLDSEGVKACLLQMVAIAKRFPQLIIIPAHDQRGFAQLPRLR